MPNVCYHTESFIPDCCGEELLVGDDVKIAVDPINDNWPAHIYATVASVRHRCPFGRTYKFAYCEQDLNGGPELRECLIKVAAVCGCEQLDIPFKCDDLPEL